MAAVTQQLNSLVNHHMFGDASLAIHQARIVPDVPVLDLAFNTVKNMQVLVVHVAHGTPRNIIPIHLGLPSLGPSTIFGEVTMGIALHRAPEGHCVYHSERNVYEVAIKRSDISGMLQRVRGNGANEENPMNEIAMMELMKTVVQQRPGAAFDQVFPHNMTFEMAATDGQSLFTILPRMKGCMELFDYCFTNANTKQARRLLPFAARMQEVKMIMRAVLHGVAGLHANNIAHRDLGLENALISMQLLPNQGGMKVHDVKVIDYGMAVFHPPAEVVASAVVTEESIQYASVDAEPVFDLFDDEEDAASIHMDVDFEEDGATTVDSATATAVSTTRRFTTPFYGKKAYAPPECYYRATETTIDPRTADVWASGCMLFMMAFDQQLWAAAHHELDAENYGRYVHADPVDGIRHLLYNRLPRAMVLAEPLLVDLLAKMLQVDPSQRLTMDEVLRHPWFTTA